jgi:hypothetical protein
MKKLSLVLVVVGLGLVWMIGSAMAATATASLTIGATVANMASLSLGETSITFPDSDPDTVLSIPADKNPVNVAAKAKTSKGSSVTLLIATPTDLTAGTATIGIDQVRWTAAGDAAFVAGTMNKAAPQAAVSGWTDSAKKTGSFSYFLANSWSYATGNYSATATYTLTSP